jgi:LmbE family N-acetylglucosaminyl deacetylase
MSRPDPVSPAIHALALLADPARSPVDATGWRVVLAHPDDESLSLGAQLHRLRGAHLILVTDGAPRDGADARRLGFPGPEAYAEARAAELAAALRAGDATALDVLALDIPDQQAAERLVEITSRLARDLVGAEVVFTHAYEGGHPDHDATAFAVHEAVRLLPAARRPDIVEMPFYRLGPQGEFVVQDFDRVPGIVPIQLALGEAEAIRKQAMLAAHHSQRDVLALFTEPIERFRSAPPHDFGVLPNGGRLWYQDRGWGWTGERWLACVAAARRELAKAPRE